MRGLDIPFDSLKESLAIFAFNKERQATLLRPIIGVADPDKVNKLISQYRVALFPELAYEELRYEKRAMNMFDKLRGINLTVKV